MSMQWLQLMIALFSLHTMSIVDDMEETNADESASRRLPPAARKGAGKRRR
jgi:hypothetical protein